MIQIIGLDISKASVSACLISQKIDEPREFYHHYDFKKIAATAQGISELLALIGEDLANTIAVMEPTGVNYQALLN
jgi:transposase